MSQKFKNADLIKRFAAWILDNLLIVVLTVGCCVSMSKIVGYEQNNQALDAVFAKYEAQYGVTFDVSEEAYMAMTDAERANYDAAYEALSTDPEALQGYGRMMGMTLIIAAVSCFLPLFVWEFLLPLCLGSGQTLGKKVFSLSVVRKNFAPITGKQLFFRSVLGKYAIETMIPLFIMLLFFWGAISLATLGILLALVCIQFLCIAMTKNHTAIHDVIAGTRVVDTGSLVIVAE